MTSPAACASGSTLTAALAAAAWSQVAITADGTQTVSGRETWKLAFEELARPTLIRNVTGMNLVMRGTLWVDPATGVIVRTSMWVADAAVLATVTVDFREDAAMSLWVPAEMSEHYRAAAGSEEAEEAW